MHRSLVTRGLAARPRLAALATLTALAALALALAPAPAAGAPTPSDVRLLQEVRLLTARYHDPARAEADGFRMSSPGCVPLKGVHFLRSVAQGQDDLDVRRPNVLVYAPRPDGGLRLLGVEYATHTPATLFGQVFVPSRAVGHHTLHVWLWDLNPEGLFAPDNPNITCRAGGRQGAGPQDADAPGSHAATSASSPGNRASMSSTRS